MFISIRKTLSDNVKLFYIFSEAMTIFRNLYLWARQEICERISKETSADEYPAIFTEFIITWMFLMLPLNGSKLEPKLPWK